MALTFTAGTPVESTGSVTSTTVTLPAGLSAGDYTIIIFSLNVSSGGITTPSGWTNILPSTATVNGSTACKIAVFYRKWVSGDGDVAVTTNSGRVGAVAIRVQGADQTTFVDVTSSVSQLATAITTLTAPAITPTSGWLINIFGCRNQTNGNFLVPFTNLQAGITKAGEAGGKSTSQTNAGVMMSYDPVTPGVDTGTRTADANIVTHGALTFSFSLNEAASGGPGDVAAVVATATSQEGTPVVTGQANIVHVKASASATDIVPVVTAAASLVGVRAQATSLAPAPTVVGAQTASVAAVRAQGSSLAIAPVVGGAQAVTAVHAQASSLALAPAVAGSTAVTAVVAQASSLALPPAVSAAASATVAPPAMLATAIGLEPSVSGGGPANISAPDATATADMRDPVVSVAATVVAVTAGASSSALAPEAQGAVSVQSIASVATAEAIVPMLEVLVFIEAVNMAATALHHAPALSLEAFTSVVLATATANMLAPHMGGDTGLYLKDGTRLLAYMLSGGILIPVDPQF